MGGSSKQTTGYWYKMMVHFGLCHGPIDALTEIRGGDRTAWSGNQTSSGRIRIDAANLWGGKKSEGGIDGNFDMMMGESTQVPNDYLTSIFGQPQTAHRGLATGVFRGGRIGANNPYPKPWSFRLRRVLQGWDGDVWYPERAVIPLAGGAIYAANPAHILYQTLTDRLRGQGEPRAIIADASWRAAADRLYTEGFGLCATYTGSSADDLTAFQQQIIDIVGGALQQDRRDGLYYLDLIRGDYDATTLPIIWPDDVLSIDIEPSEPSEAINQVLVEWFDPVTKADRTTAPIRSLANIASTGGVQSQTLTMREIPIEALALRVAQRELQGYASPATRIELTINRRAMHLRAGQPFRLHYPAEQIEDMILLVVDIDRGELTRGTVKITAIQDASRMADTTYVAQSPDLWQPQSHAPMPAPYRRVIEAPYAVLAGVLPAAELEAIPDDAGIILTVGARPTGLALDYALATAGPGEGFEDRSGGVFEFCPTALVLSAADRISTQFQLAVASELDRVVIGSIALWDGEVVRVDAIDSGSGAVKLARGCVDTVPAAHASGSRIWFLGDDYGSDQREYSEGETVGVKLLTRTPSAQLPIDTAPADTVTMAARQIRPYLPGSFRINGQAYPDTVTGEISLTWAHRDRILQADQVVDTTATDIGPEPGVTYVVVLRDSAGNVIRIVDDITDNHWIYNADDDAADGSIDPLDVEIFSVRDGVSSIQSHRHTVNRI